MIAYVIVAILGCTCLKNRVSFVHGQTWVCGLHSLVCGLHSGLWPSFMVCGLRSRFVAFVDQILVNLTLDMCKIWMKVTNLNEGHKPWMKVTNQWMKVTNPSLTMDKRDPIFQTCATQFFNLKTFSLNREWCIDVRRDANYRRGDGSYRRGEIVKVP